jgi:hypothetical protein
VESVVLWIATDKAGFASAYKSKPSRAITCWVGEYVNQLYEERRLLPALAAQTWKDEPIRVRWEVLE